MTAISLPRTRRSSSFFRPMISRPPSFTLPLMRAFEGSRPSIAIELALLPEPDSPTIASAFAGVDEVVQVLGRRHPVVVDGEVDRESADLEKVAVVGARASVAGSSGVPDVAEGENGGVDRREQMLHSRFNRIMAIIVWAVAALVAGLALWGSDPRLTWVYPAAALAAFLGWAALWRPSVGVSEAGIAIRNVSHRVDIPWEALIHLDTQACADAAHARPAFTAWSAPAPGIMTVSDHRPSRAQPRGPGRRVARRARAT